METKKRTEQILEEMKTLVSSSSFNQLDLDLLKHKCLALYENILQLSLPDPSGQAILPKEAAPLIEQQVNVPDLFAQPETIAAPEPESIPEISEEPLVPLLEEEKEEEIAPLPEIEETLPPVPSETIVPPVANMTEKKELSLHEKLSASSEHRDPSEHFHGKVESIKASINLNKKIAMVNELFKENTVDYAKAIDRLNTSASLDEALRYFNELKHQYSWENDHELVKYLESLIAKRY